MKNDIQIRSIIKLDFWERVKVLFGRLVVLDSLITTDQPFERSNHICTAFVESTSTIEHWKTKPDLVRPDIEANTKEIEE